MANGGNTSRPQQATTGDVYLASVVDANPAHAEVTALAGPRPAPPVLGAVDRLQRTSSLSRPKVVGGTLVVLVVGIAIGFGITSLSGSGGTDATCPPVPPPPPTCDDITCHNDGHCLMVENAPYCTCTAGFGGSRCLDVVDGERSEDEWEGPHWEYHHG